MTLIAAASHYPYSPTPSLASTASTTSSAWSVADSASSAATSTTSIGTPSARDSYTAPSTAKISSLPLQTIPGCTAPRDQIPAFRDPRPLADAQPVPLEKRQHPRRTNRLVRDVSATATATATAAVAAAAAAAASAITAVAPYPAPEGCDDGTVPSLKRQADRKLCFVETLVGMYG